MRKQVTQLWYDIFYDTYNVFFNADPVLLRIFIDLQNLEKFGRDMMSRTLCIRTRRGALDREIYKFHGAYNANFSDILCES